jgi:hypothetical protein
VNNNIRSIRQTPEDDDISDVCDLLVHTNRRRAYSVVGTPQRSDLMSSNDQRADDR